jgi:uncharacterized membrane protein YdcZ (DUF606 family)
MSKELDKINKIEDNIMNQIHDGKIKMRPKSYFIFGSILTFIGLVSSVIASVFLFGLIRFSIRSHGPMGSYKFEKMLSNFPWWALLLAIVGLIAGIWLLRKYDFSFKVNFKAIIVLFILAIMIGGWIIDSTGLNDKLIQRGPMRGVMRQYMQEPNLQMDNNAGRGWGKVNKDSN